MLDYFRSKESEYPHELTKMPRKANALETLAEAKQFSVLKVNRRKARFGLLC